MTNISKHLLTAEVMVSHLRPTTVFNVTFSDIECLWDHKSSSREAAELKTIHTYVSLAYPESTYYNIKSYSSSAVITGED